MDVWKAFDCVAKGLFRMLELFFFVLLDQDPNRDLHMRLADDTASGIWYGNLQY